jgi:hypothetical protein
VRDYCETLGWDKTDPGPELPEDVVAGTRARYVEAFERLTGIAFDDYLADPRSCSREGDRPRPARSPGSSTRRARPCRARCASSASRSTRPASAACRPRARRGDAGRRAAELERMCEQLLANPLIESYEIDVER